MLQRMPRQRSGADGDGQQDHPEPQGPPPSTRFATLARAERKTTTTPPLTRRCRPQNFLSMYSYGDIIRNYALEPRFAISVDINAKLDAIPIVNTSELAFHGAVARALQ